MTLHFRAKYEGIENIKLEWNGNVVDLENITFTLSGTITEYFLKTGKFSFGGREDCSGEFSVDTKYLNQIKIWIRELQTSWNININITGIFMNADSGNEYTLKLSGIYLHRQRGNRVWFHATECKIL
jgi:hypothetical protein